MQLTAKQIHARLTQIKPLVENRSLETLRRGQNALGELMHTIHRARVQVKRHDFSDFPAAWVLPKDIRREGVVLYLHGGGYTCGGLEYALGFGAALADECGVRVFCAAYRLAPESRFPAALEDAAVAYQYLLDKGYPPEEINLCGESAGGGLCYCLCMYLRQRELLLPGSIIAISPWVDLTGSGESNPVYPPSPAGLPTAGTHCSSSAAGRRDKFWQRCPAASTAAFAPERGFY